MISHQYLFRLIEGHFEACDVLTKQKYEELLKVVGEE